MAGNVFETHPVLTGHEAREFPGTKDTAVLLSHGFTGSPVSVTGWAQALNAQGYTVSVPRLPGHGTAWQDLKRVTWQDWVGELREAYARLAVRYDSIVLAGLSMGGGLVLRLAEIHPEVRGIMLVNPALATANMSFKLLPVARFAPGGRRGFGTDSAKPVEFGLDTYNVTPYEAAFQLTRLWEATAPHLGIIDCPILYFRSLADHVVDDTTLPLVQSRVSSTDFELEWLPNSYHVATVDYDAEHLFSRSIDWMDAHGFAG